ncbi:polymer-forming cytoskeletal protein [bacterium]|nr:polymer-forming cytoskeletal protein [bacterium]MBU1884721.1 polymer-forming cytoskeletal protein [bacterium]
MAIFNNSDIKPESNNNNNGTDASTTIITVGAFIKGEVNLECDLYVDGEFEGVINSKKNVNIGKNGHVKGNIIAKYLIIQGKVDGTVDADKVHIKAGGHVVGTITSSELIIEAKGIFEGDSKIKTNSSAKVS